MWYSEGPGVETEKEAREVGQSKKEPACPLVDNGLGQSEKEQASLRRNKPAPWWTMGS